jgi:predicted nucleotidyltransferase
MRGKITMSREIAHMDNQGPAISQKGDRAMMARQKINIDMEKIRSFCTRWNVQEMSLFGSVLREDFKEGSDVDVLVRFSPGKTPTLFALSRMEKELEDIFGRKVDLVERSALEQSRNYIRRNEILNSLETIYAA